jgi:hypothetical protein
MRGLITEKDFEKVDECFPGIVHYYRELKEKPRTFLELLWGFTQSKQLCPEPVEVATGAATSILGH